MPKSRLHPVLHAAVVIVAFMGIHATAAAGPNGPELLTDLRSVPGRALPSHAIAAPGLAGRVHPAALAYARLQLRLPGAGSVIAQRMRVAESQGRMTWVGEFEGLPGSMISLTASDGIVAGFFDDGEKIFELGPGPGGLHQIYQIDADGLPGFGHPSAPELLGGTAEASGPVTAAASIIQDLLVVYTPASRQRYGGADPTPVENRIISAVEAANQAYQNSALDLQLNIVYLDEIAYVESGDMGVSLDHLRLTADGNMDEVHTLRNQFGADLVALITEDSNYCGIAYVMSSDSTSFAPWAVGVTYSACLTNQTLAHEIGHNQGNMHDRANSSNPGAYAYSYGFRRCETDGTGFRTVMSYSCNGGTRVAHFSNPNVTYNGFPTGIDQDADPASSADAVRSMSNTAATVAAFRPSAATTPPVGPTGLSATPASHERIDLAWTDNAVDENGYRVERSSDGVNFSEIATPGSNTTSHSDTGLAASTLYYYRVRAYNGAGNSGYSNTDSATTQTPPPPPAMPGGFTATAASGSGIDLAWNDVTDESGYRLERIDSASGLWTEIADLPADSTGFSDSGLELGATYFYRLFAYNGSGNSDPAGPVSAQTLTLVDAYAQSASASSGTFSGDIAALRIDDGATQRLSETESGGKPSKRTSEGQASWQFDVSPGMSVTVIATAWVTGNVDEDSFDFQYSLDGSGYSPLFIVDGSQSGTVYVASLPSSVSGSMTVRATDTNRDPGARSLETLNVDHLVIRTEADPNATPPAAPSLAQATAVSHSLVSVSWTDNATDESGFRIQRSDNGGPWTGIATVNADTTSYEDETVGAGTGYAYRVAAYNGAGDSAWTDSNAVTTPAAPPGPSLAVSGYKVKGRQAVDLVWSGAAGSVDIYRDSGVIATGSSGSNGSGTWTDDIGVKGGGSYTYQVCDAGTSTCSPTEQVIF
jgi:fibronectin type 3 domain-containing protein